jgi:hypothetical protein
MTPADRTDPRPRAGRDRRSLAPVDRERFDPAAANAQMAETLRLNGLRRRLRARGLVLRHSDYGYSLIDAAQDRVGDRNDLTLDDVEEHLDAARRS